jgi:hypothetical protein
MLGIKLVAATVTQAASTAGAAQLLIRRKFTARDRVYQLAMGTSLIPTNSSVAFGSLLNAKRQLGQTTAECRLPQNRRLVALKRRQGGALVANDAAPETSNLG